MFGFYIQNINAHQRYLQMALNDAQKLTPITPYIFATLSNHDAYVFEMLNSRFSKMQDDIGTKIFPVILEIAGAKSIAFIDNLNMLEKLEILESAAWWQSLRTLKNAIAQTDDTKHDVLAAHTNELLIKGQEIIDFWEELKPKLEILKHKLP
jgi:hypothetical protein